MTLVRDIELFWYCISLEHCWIFPSEAVLGWASEVSAALDTRFWPRRGTSMQLLKYSKLSDLVTHMASFFSLEAVRSCDTLRVWRARNLPGTFLARRIGEYLSFESVH